MAGMLTKINKMRSVYSNGCARASVWVEQNSSMLMFAFGALVLTLGMHDLASAQAGGDAAGAGRYGTACGRLLQLIEGPFGALITAAAGIGAIVAAALGGFKLAWVLVVTSVGAFILRGYITLFFAACPL